MSDVQRPTPALLGPENRPLDAANPNPLSAFKAFLYNGSDDRSTLSNAIAFWDFLPKYANEGLNQEPKVPAAAERWFTYLGERFKFTQFPGTTKDHRNQSDLWVARYPGVREQAVEIALLKLATEDGGVCDVKRARHNDYGVVFSIRRLRDTLKGLGHTLSHYQVVEALDILTMSSFILESGNGGDTTTSHILTEYQASSASGNARYAPNARWRVNFHRVVANAIESAQIRQFDLSLLFSRRSLGIALVKRLIFASNLSADHPVKVGFKDLRETTSGLGHSRLSDGVSYLEKEIKRLQAEGVLASYTKDVTRKKTEGGGRPAVVDAVFTLYPSEQLVAEVKRGNKRQMLTEQALGLSPRLRSERQRQLALTLDDGGATKKGQSQQL